MKSKLIYSDDPDKAVWWKLAGYKNVTKVSEELRSLHSKPENAMKQARQIKNCLEQADEYFQAASVVSIATQPLLLYYGMVSLSWALILYKSNGDFALDRLDHEHLEHGLSRPRIDYSLRNLPLPELLSAITTKVSLLVGNDLRGTFGLLAQVSRLEPATCKFKKRDGNVISSFNVMHTHAAAAKVSEFAGKTLTLKDFLLQIPDMGPFLFEIGIRFSFATISHFEGRIEHDNSRVVDLMTSRCTEDETKLLEDSFAKYDKWTVKRVPTGIHAQLHFEEGETPPSPIISETVHGKRYIYLKDEDALAEPARFLGGMFLFGMLVRYFPHVWMHYIDAHHPIVDVVEAFMPIAKRSYPNLILNNLSGDSFSFRRQE